MSQQSKETHIALHILAGLLGLAFLMTGGMKLTGSEEMAANFARWGFPGWFMFVVGAIEVLSAILMVIPRTRFYGASILTGTMVGAVATHLWSNEAPQAVPALVLGVLSSVQVWVNRHTLTGLAGDLFGRREPAASDQR